MRESRKLIKIRNVRVNIILKTTVENNYIFIYVHSDNIYKS